MLCLLHLSDLLLGPLSGPRRCPKVLGYRTLPSNIWDGTERFMSFYLAINSILITSDVLIIERNNLMSA